MIYMYIYLWCPSGALASNFFGWLAPFVFSISIFTCSSEGLAQGDIGLYLYLYLFFALACSIPVGYVHEICMMCLHVQFPEDMCTNFDLYRICACIFNSWRICGQVLCSSFLTCMGFRVCMFNSRKICAWLLYCMGSMLSYSIPVGYVHDFMCSDLLDYFGWKIH